MTTNDKTVGDERAALIRLMELADDYALAFRAMECVIDNSDSDEERSALEKALRASLTTPSKEPAGAVGIEPMHMLLCEFGRLVPRPDVTYRPIFSPGCAECERLAASQTEAYGERSPTYEEAEALAAPGAAIDARDPAVRLGVMESVSRDKLQHIGYLCLNNRWRHNKWPENAEFVPIAEWERNHAYTRVEKVYVEGAKP